MSNEQIQTIGLWVANVVLMIAFIAGELIK
jgi:hypothetical protein